MKVINWCIIAIFIFFAALQYNNADPYVWMPLYLFGTFLCYLAIYKKYNVVFAGKYLKMSDEIIRRSLAS